MLQGVWMRVAGARVEEIQVVHLKSPPPALATSWSFVEKGSGSW